jgi:hypothetical protein
MGSRLLPLALALGTLAADGLGLHDLASLTVLLAVVAAASAAFVGLGRVLAGQGKVLHACTTTLALCLILAGSVVRSTAPLGARVPTLALSTLVLASVVYALPLLSWVLEPLLAWRPRIARMRPVAGR